MSSLTVGSVTPSLEVVELRSVPPEELEVFWRREVTVWRSRLRWDVSSAVTALRRALVRRAIEGKAVRRGTGTVGYAYYVVEGDRGVVSGWAVAPGEGGRPVGEALLQAVLDELQRRRARRIESQFISFESPWLTACFERRGFRTYWREFLRLTLSGPRPHVCAPVRLNVSGWRAWNLSEAASVMQRAHFGSVDAEMNELYRTDEGCRILLTNLLRQRGCGTAVSQASAVARETGGRGTVGFTIATEIAERQAHLAQVAVVPSHQRRGIGRSLLDHTVTRLGEQGFETLSLMVSEGNDRARRLYRSFGFEPVLRFPVFSWER